RPPLPEGPRTRSRPYARPWPGMPTCFMLAGRLTEERKQFLRVLKAKPSHARALRNLACTLWRMDAFDELVKVLPEVKGGLSATVGAAQELRGAEAVPDRRASVQPGRVPDGHAASDGGGLRERPRAGRVL